MYIIHILVTILELFIFDIFAISMVTSWVIILNARYSLTASILSPALGRDINMQLIGEVSWFAFGKVGVGLILVFTRCHYYDLPSASVAGLVFLAVSFRCF